MGKKRCFLAVFFLLSLVLPVCAVEDYETEIYSGSVASGETFTADGGTFKVVFSGDPDKVSVTMPGGYGVVVEKGICEIDNYYDICFDSTEFWYHNYTIDRDYYKAAIKIYTVLAQLSLARAIEKTSFLIGEETKIDATIENTGGRTAADIVFVDEFPASFIIKGIEGCSLEGNRVMWRGNLGINGKKECSYVIEALAFVTHASKATVSYNDGDTLKEATNSQTITIPDYQLNMLSSSEDVVEAGGEVELDADLTNMHDTYDINVVDFYVNVPTQLKVTEKAKLFEQSYNKYKWSGTLAPLEKKDFYLKLRGDSVGSYKIEEYAEFIINNIRKKIQKEVVIKVTGPVLSVGYDISKKSLKSLEKSNINIEATNPSSRYSIRNIELTVKADIPDFQNIRKTIGSLGAGESRTILNTYFTAPNVTESGEYSVNITAGYESDFGKGEIKNKEEISISPVVEETAEEAATEDTTDVSEELASAINATAEEETVKAENLTDAENLTATIFQGPKEPGFWGAVAGVVLLTLIIAASLIVFIVERRHKSIHFFRRKLDKISRGRGKAGKEPEKRLIGDGLKGKLGAAREMIEKKEAPIKEKIGEEIEKIKEGEAHIRKMIAKEIGERIKESGGKIRPVKEEKIEETEEVKKELEELEKTGREIREHEKTKFRF